jgi:GH15 family glucan-1,4-alpha-glucosidase
MPAVEDYLHCRYQPDGTLGPDDWPTFQLDGPGIWLWSLAHHVRCGGRLTAEHLDAVTVTARYLSALWDHPSNDAWEESPDHVHTSTLGAILAGLRAAEGLAGDRVTSITSVATARIEDHMGIGSAALTKWDGNPELDASLLWLAVPYRLLDAAHPAFAATLRRIEADLVDEDGGVHRYRADTYYGGGAWLLLTAALGRVYLCRNGRGDRARARRCLAWVERQAGADGSLPEQVATHAYEPGRIREWQTLWGESASPLLWSHATYLALLTELDA